MSFKKLKREDLLKDAVAYARRIVLVLRLEGESVEFFAGQRAGGAWSFYFDESPVLQFNAAGALRRLFVEDRRLTAENGSLVELRRSRVLGERRVTHDHNQLNPESEHAIKLCCLGYLRLAHEAVQAGDFHEQGQFPTADPSVLADLEQQLSILSRGFSVALTANAL